MTKEITLKARYGLKHNLGIIDENTYRAIDFSRFSYENQDENGKYIGVRYIDFDGGPFLAIGGAIPGVEGKTIKAFEPMQEDISKIPYIDIILEDEKRQENI